MNIHRHYLKIFTNLALLISCGDDVKASSQSTLGLLTTRHFDESLKTNMQNLTTTTKEYIITETGKIKSTIEEKVESIQGQITKMEGSQNTVSNDIKGGIQDVKTETGEIKNLISGNDDSDTTVKKDIQDIKANIENLETSISNDIQGLQNLISGDGDSDTTVKKDINAIITKIENLETSISNDIQGLQNLISGDGDSDTTVKKDIQDIKANIQTVKTETGEIKNLISKNGGSDTTTKEVPSQDVDKSSASIDDIIKKVLEYQISMPIWKKKTIHQGTYNAIAYGDGTFMAVANDKVSYSPNNGETWNDVAADNHLWKSIVYGDNVFLGIYVDQNSSYIVQLNKTGTMGTSTFLSNPSMGTFSPITSIGNNKFICIGSGQKPYLLTWNSESENITVEKDNVAYDVINSESEAKTIAYGKNKYVVTCADGEMYSSPDLKNWVKQKIVLTDNSEQDIVATSGCVFGSDKFIALNGDGANYTSSDGSTWTAGKALVNLIGSQ